ncbi:MAG TPA: acyl-CoA thioester hydrolase/BAAT C-terminal domain-containing protein [Xanthobacteraceae bacterium]
MPQAQGRDVVLLLPDTHGPTIDDRMASLLASRGHVVFELAIPDGGERPAQRNPVPIEYFSRAVDFLRREYAGPGGRIDVVAFGRATEAAAILALTRGDIARMVLVSPSSVTNAAEARGLPTDRPAWTLRGAPLAFVHRVADEEQVLQRQRPPYATRPLYDLRLAAAAGDGRARIPFDQITSDRVLVACDQDAVWPADRMAQDVRALASHGRASVTAHILSDCGHDLVAPIAPTTRRDFAARDGVRYALGGTPQAVWEGQRAAWDIIRHAIGAAGGEP